MKKLLEIGDRVKVLCPKRAGDGVIIKITKTGYNIDLDHGGVTWTWHCYVEKI
jgi:sRNA-binding protein